MTEIRENTIYKTTWVGFAVNVLLSAGKLLAGVLGHSSAMLADGVHSLSDFLTDMVVLVFVRLSSKPKDASHDYGHGKYETLATIVIGLALFAVAIGILVKNAELISSVLQGKVIERPGLIALVAAAISIAAKEALFWYTIAAAKRVNSPALKANAWHHRSDAFSSIGTLIGIGGAYFLGEKWRILDPLAAIVVGALIIKVAYDLVRPGFDELLERSLPDSIEHDLLNLIMEDTQLSDPHNLKTRRIGANIAVEIHVRVPGQMTVEQSHQATVAAEKRIRAKYGEGTLVIVHVEPTK